MREPILNFERAAMNSQRHAMPGEDQCGIGLGAFRSAC